MNSKERFDEIEQFVRGVNSCSEQFRVDTVVVPAEDWKVVEEFAEETGEGLDRLEIDGAKVFWSSMTDTPTAEVRM
jgi:hypothetical protein